MPSLKILSQDVSVLHCNEGKSNKLYVIATYHDETNQVYGCFAMYKAVNASRWNCNSIASWTTQHKAERDSLAQKYKKTSKGYHELLTDIELIKVGLMPRSELCFDIELKVAEVVYNQTIIDPVNDGTPGEPVEYECVDDFNTDGLYVVGCIYPGFMKDGRLYIEADDGQARKVEIDQFKRVEQKE